MTEILWDEIRAVVDALEGTTLQGTQIWMDDVIIAEVNDPVMARFFARAPQLARLALMISDEGDFMGPASTIPPDIHEEATQLLEELSEHLQGDEPGDEPHATS